MIMNSILEQARKIASMIIFIINPCNLFGKQNSTFSDPSPHYDYHDLTDYE